jgi:hypothetical protein
VGTTEHSTANALVGNYTSHNAVAASEIHVVRLFFSAFASQTRDVGCHTVRN